MADLSVEVWTTVGLSEIRAGVARFSFKKGVTTSFAYDQTYISTPGAYDLDNMLSIAAGGGYCSPLPPSFRDSSPDRWGQRLIEQARREKAAGRLPRALTEVDYLLGVSDATRQGALRFRAGGEWLGAGMEIPPAVNLHKLLVASHRVLSGTESHEELKALLDVGTTALGGAHPKASVRDGDKLLLAKFSHPQDKHDVIGLEKTMLDLFPIAGIDAPSSQLVRFGSHAALLVERFDREGGLYDGRRIPYQSAMSMLGLTDGEQGSYLDLASEMLQKSGDDDIEQLLRRICFSYAFNNTDDHMKNHGFLLEEGRWRLSPCFDVNPTLFEKPRATVITGSYLPEPEQITELCALLAVKPGTMENISRDVDNAARTFSAAAARNSVPHREIEIVDGFARERCGALRNAIASRFGAELAQRPKEEWNSRSINDAVSAALDSKSCAQAPIASSKEHRHREEER